MEEVRSRKILEGRHSNSDGGWSQNRWQTTCHGMTIWSMATATAKGPASNNSGVRNQKFELRLQQMVMMVWIWRRQCRQLIGGPPQWSSCLKSAKNNSDNHNGKLPEIKLIFGWQQWWWALKPVEKGKDTDYTSAVSWLVLADGNRMAENAKRAWCGK